MKLLCPGCGNEIDPDCCHCGDLMESHGIGSGHSPVPMGCDCGRDPTPYCNYGHRTQAECDCGPIADNE